MSLYKATRSGTARNGAERDRGHIVHLVTKNDFPSWETAICGVQPRGNGWHYRDGEGEGVEVTCEKCKKKSEKLNQLA